uniref:Uncharacterized protein n=1 Tax=Plectus sambesii TaxID=2011161 RepID=A0A914WDD5_9BILA
MEVLKVVILLAVTVIECSGSRSLPEYRKFGEELLGKEIAEYLNNNSIAYALQGFVINTPPQRRCFEHKIDIAQSLQNVKEILLADGKDLEEEYEGMVDSAMLKAGARYVQEMLGICNTSTAMHEGLEAEFRRGTAAERNKRVAGALIVAGVGVGIMFLGMVAWQIYQSIEFAETKDDVKILLHADKERNEKVNELFEARLENEKEQRRQLLQYKIDQFVSQALMMMSSAVKEMLLSGVPDVRILSLDDMKMMFQRDMGLALWNQSIYAIELTTMYGLAVVKPVSCEPDAERLAIEICYPVVKTTDMHSLFHVRHRGAFNEDKTIFGYAKVAEYVGVPLNYAMQKKISDVETVDLARCELKFGTVWMCHGFARGGDHSCGVAGLANCTWQLMPVENHGFVDVRVIGDRYLIATTVKEFIRMPTNRSVMDHGKKEQIYSNIFELELFNEVAIIGSEHLLPISAVTNVKADFLTPILDIVREDIYDEKNNTRQQKLVKLTRDVSEATSKFSIASNKLEDDLDSMEDYAKTELKMSASEAVMGLSEDMNDSNDPEHRKKDGLLTFMTKNLLNPFGFFHGAAQNAEYRKNRKRSKALAKRAVAEVEIDVSLSDINNSLSSKLQSLSINESAPEVDSDEDLERQIHDENINLFPGGNQDAVRNVLDGISPYCESQEFLYQNLQGAGQREIGIEEQEEDATLGFINDIDGIVVMSRNLDFYNFEHKKYQLMTKVIPRDVTSMLKKCRKMVFDHENSDDDASRQPVQQLIWSTRLFAECPVHVFYYTVPDDDDLRQMEGGGFSERQPKSIGCHEIIKQAFAGVIYELGVELRDRRRRLAEQNRSAEYIIENAPMCLNDKCWCGSETDLQCDLVSLKWELALEWKKMLMECLNINDLLIYSKE